MRRRLRGAPADSYFTPLPILVLRNSSPAFQVGNAGTFAILTPRARPKSAICVMPGKVPICVIFIGRPMIVIGVVLLEYSLAEVSRLADIVASLRNREGRDAYAGERKMVRAVVVALARLRVRLDSQIELSGRLLDQRPESCSLGSGDGNIFGFAERIERIVIEINSGLAGGDDRMFAVVVGAEQAGFFRGHEEEESGAASVSSGMRCPDTSHLQNDRAAGGVIDRAIVDLVAIDRLADSEVVPVRGEQDGFDWLRVVPSTRPTDIAARDLAQLYGNVTLERESPAAPGGTIFRLAIASN